MQKYKNFKEILTDIKSSGLRADLVLGNGFSRGIFDKEFKYPSLLEKVMSHIELDKRKDTTNLTNLDNLKSLLHKNKVAHTNLEYYLQLMEEAGVCIPFFRGTNYLKLNNFKENALKTDVKLLKKLILDTISEIHPDTWLSKAAELNNCSNNLINFHRIFSLNYDLILYWTILKANEKGKHIFRDGMWMETENTKLKMFSVLDNKVNIYFLHGAIHLLEDSGDTFKIIKHEGDIRLKEVITDLKDNWLNYHNLMILEGTSEGKVSIISKNSYLHKGLQCLYKSKENLVIYGCSIIDENTNMINNDKHIWRNIINSPFKKLYVGLHENNQNIFLKQKYVREELKKLYLSDDFEAKDIEFFTTINSDIWSKLDNS